MAQIISSSFSTDAPQIDGRLWVTEVHTLDDGSTQTFRYLAAPGLDFQAIAADRAAAINAELTGQADGE